MWLVLIVVSCVTLVVVKIFASWFDQVVNLITMLALCVLGVITLLFEATVFNDHHSYLIGLGFIVFFMAIQLLVLMIQLV